MPQRSPLPEGGCLGQNLEPDGPVGGMGKPTSYSSAVLTICQCDPHRPYSLSTATL